MMFVNKSENLEQHIYCPQIKVLISAGSSGTHHEV